MGIKRHVSELLNFVCKYIDKIAENDISRLVLKTFKMLNLLRSEHAITLSWQNDFFPWGKNM